MTLNLLRMTMMSACARGSSHIICIFFPLLLGLFEARSLRKLAFRRWPGKAMRRG